MSSRAELSAIWLSVFIVPIFFLYGWTRLDTKVSAVQCVMREHKEFCSKLNEEQKILLKSSIDAVFLITQKSLINLSEKGKETEKKTNDINLEMNDLSIQILDLYQHVEKLEKDKALTSAEIKETEKRLGKILGEVSRLNNTLAPENLKEKKKKYLDTQVKVKTEKGSGSGTILRGNYVLTAQHVIENGGIVQVEHGNKLYPTRLIRGSAEYDLALLKVVTTDPLPFAKLAGKEADSLPVLSEVYVVGYPGGVGPHFTKGEICSRTADHGVHGAWLMNSLITFGNSGGAVFNPKTEELIGVPVAMSMVNGLPVYFMSYMVPAVQIRGWLEAGNVKIE